MRDLTEKELIEINGGRNEEAYNAAYQFGQTCRKAFDGALLILARWL